MAEGRVGLPAAYTDPGPATQPHEIPVYLLAGSLQPLYGHLLLRITGYNSEQHPDW